MLYICRLSYHIHASQPLHVFRNKGLILSSANAKILFQVSQRVKKQWSVTKYDHESSIKSQDSIVSKFYTLIKVLLDYARIFIVEMYNAWNCAHSSIRYVVRSIVANKSEFRISQKFFGFYLLVNMWFGTDTNMSVDYTFPF